MKVPSKVPCFEGTKVSNINKYLSSNEDMKVIKSKSRQGLISGSILTPVLIWYLRTFVQIKLSGSFRIGYQASAYSRVLLSNKVNETAPNDGGCFMIVRSNGKHFIDRSAVCPCDGDDLHDASPIR